MLKQAWFSRLYGSLQKSSWSRRKVLPFIQNFSVDAAEFAEEPTAFRSFNDFFVRKLKPEVRPISPDPGTAILPADGRYLCYPSASEATELLVKGQRFSLATLLRSTSLAQEYQDGPLVLARLCPSDYHRFHFPCDGRLSPIQLINGYLYSVNPWALAHNVGILTENKRMLSRLDSELYGPILCLEIGATNVGSIVYTCDSEGYQKKGNEKGYFEFGGSALIFLFKPGSIQLASDLLEKTQEGIETRGRLGQVLGGAR